MPFLSRSAVRHLLRWAACSIALACVAEPAQAQGVYFDRESVLRELFADAERVDYVRIQPRQHADALRRQLGYLPTRMQYVVYVGWVGDKAIGYALIDEEIGQHLPITFATQLDAEGRILRSEVMAYREAYGHEIRQRRFRNQFNGKTRADALRVGRDIDAISGATISSRSMAVAVRRAVAIIDLARTNRAEPPAKTAAKSSASNSGATR